MKLSNFPHLTSKYKLIRRIGQGGMAQVFLAEKIGDSSKQYAIKIISEDRINTEEQRWSVIKKRFIEEIKNASKIKSPYVAMIYDYYINTENEEYYLVQEYIEGEVLRDKIRTVSKLSLEDAVEYSRQIALGFEEIHRNEVIHRDLKDTNIMISNTNRVKIIDFGIAVNKNSEKLTAEHKVIGSVHYLAPEIIKSQPATVQTDIYALGILLYQMIIGHPPYWDNENQDIAQIIKKHNSAKIIAPSKIDVSIPNALSNVTLKATALDPRQRYSSMREFYEDINTCLSTERADEKLIDLNSISKKPTFFEVMSSTWGILILVSITFLVALIIAVLLIVIFTQNQN